MNTGNSKIDCSHFETFVYLTPWPLSSPVMSAVFWLQCIILFVIISLYQNWSLDTFDLNMNVYELSQTQLRLCSSFYRLYQNLK